MAENVIAVAGGRGVWQTVGRDIGSAMTTAEAMSRGGLDWTVVKEAILTESGTKVADHFATVRQDNGKVLGVVGRRYTPFQNTEAFSFMDALVGEGLVQYETAGALGGGKRVWMLARLPQEMRIVGDDVVKPYILLSNSHNGTSTIQILPTSVRVVCQNTLNYAIRVGQAEKSVFSIRHTRSVATQVEAARKSLGLIQQGFETMRDEMKALASVSMRDTEVTGYFESLFPTRPTRVAAVRARVHEGQVDGASLLNAMLNGHDQNREVVGDLLKGYKDAQEKEYERNREIFKQLVDNFHNEKNTLPGIEGTAWAALNSVTEWADHQAKVKGRDNAARNESRMNSIFFGTSADIKQQAYSSILEYASQAV